MPINTGRLPKLIHNGSDFLQRLIGSISEESYTGSDIRDPYEDTCEWLLQRHSFCDWLDADNGIFWMKGNPGAGKSVLMKYLLNDHDGLLQKQIRKSGCIIKAGYFFRVTRTTSERCVNGMLRTVLFQIFQREMRAYQKCLPALRELRAPYQTAEHIKWTDRQLHVIFDNVFQGLHGDDRPARLLFFLDALDECLEPEMESILDSLHKLLSTARNYDISLGICISSRPWPGLDHEVGAASGWISLQKENRDAIYTYIKRELASRRDVRRGEDYHGRFAEQVAERADGVFLWVALVVPRLRKKIENGGTLRELEALLKDIPNDLRELFIDILKRIADPDLGITMRILQIATLVRRRLTLEEFQHALAFQPNSPYTSMKDWKRSPDYLEAGQMVIARLQHYSGGLLEVREEPEVENDTMTQYNNFLEMSSPKTVFPNHTTLRKEHTDHLTHGAQHFDILQRTSSVLKRHKSHSWESKLDLTPPKGHTQVKVGSSKVQSGENASLAPPSQTTPIFERANIETENMLATQSHAQNTSTTSSDGWRQHRTRFAHTSRPYRSFRVVQFIHETAKNFFREHEGFQTLYSLIEDLNQTKSGPNPFCSPAGSYITGGHEFIVNSCASYLNLHELRQQLGQALKLSTMSRIHGFPFAQYISESWLHHLRAAEDGGVAQAHILEWLISIQPSALNQYICWAGEHNLTSWVRWCIETEADVNDIDATLVSYGRPIKAAVANGFYELTKLMIKAGANVNGTAGGPETTLRLAERKGNERMAKMLRKYGGVLTQPHLIPPKGQTVIC